MAMGGRGRRQVLQLDDVSSSHPPRRQVFQRPHSNDQRPVASNPLLSLVGQYNSDSSSDEDENEIKAGRGNQEEREAKEKSVKDRNTDETTAQIGARETNGKEVDGVEIEIPLPRKADPPPPKGQEPETLQEIPLPEPSSAALPLAGEQGGSSIDSEVASFLAEIESISKDQVASPAPDDKKDPDHATSADSSQPAESDFGFIPRPDASVSLEEAKESKALLAGEEKKSRPSSSSSAYKSMFVKGAVEFTKKEKEVEKRVNGAEADEELPEEPVSEWQMVQDASTQYYYYWNLSTNEVTWEIPPGYTQFLLRYREYEERLAKIPKEKLQQLKEKKKQRTDSKPESSGSTHSLEANPQSKSKHRKDKHRKETTETASSVNQIGPQLPPQEPATTATDDIRPNTDETQENEESSPKDNKSTTTTNTSQKVNDSNTSGEAVAPLDSAVDSTSHDSTDMEAFFKAALAAVAGESVADSSSSKTTAITSSAVDISASGSSISVSGSMATAESIRPTSSVDSVKPGSPVAMDTDSSRTPPTTTTATVSAAVVSSSSVVLMAAVPPEQEVKDSSAGSDEAVVTNSGVKDDATNGDDDDDDFDMDFDDIDDLDRALEKALEKKLEKRKAELEKLEKKDPEDVSISDSVSLPSSSRSEPSQSESQKQKITAAKSSSPFELESAVSSSVKMPPDAKTEVPSSKQTAVSSASVGDGEVAGTSGIKPILPKSKPSKSKSSKSKRSAVESSNGNEKLEPGPKKARLVAYDTQTDEESLDTSDEVTTTPVKVVMQLPDDADNDNFADILPTPPPERADNLAEIMEMANTALAKLAFLDVTSDGLSHLQISLIQLQTRLADWEDGGLIGEYFYQRLHEVDTLLKQYESTAVPDSWACRWDSTFRRYFYTNTQTGESQWDYPKINSNNSSCRAMVDSTATTDSRKSSAKKKGKGLKKRKAKAVEQEPGSSSAVSIVEATSAVLAEDGAGLATSRRAAMTTVMAAAEEDLDGVAMAEEEVAGCEDLQLTVDNATDNQPSVAASTATAASAAAPATADPENGGDGFQAALQALFPGEPLPPGTELLLGLPPPPPPPLPPVKEGPITSDEAYTHADDSSSDSDAKDDNDEEKHEGRVQKLDPEIDGEELIEDEEDEEGEDDERDRKEEGEEEVPPPPAVQEDPAVISRPPQLRFPAAVSSQSSSTLPSSSSASYLASGGEPSSSTVSAPHVRSAGPQLNSAALMMQPDSASSITGNPAITSAHSPRPASPKVDEALRSTGSPGPANEATSSSAGDSHRHEKHKKKKKEKLGSHTMSLKKKGVSSLVQKWQKVKKEVEQEERANEKRQQAIRQQLEEWKKENS